MKSESPAPQMLRVLTTSISSSSRMPLHSAVPPSPECFSGAGVALAAVGAFAVSAAQAGAASKPSASTAANRPANIWRTRNVDVSVAIVIKVNIDMVPTNLI